MNSFNGKNFKTIYYKYYNLKKKWINNNANIWYNKTCKDKNVTPKYAYSKNKTYNTRLKLASTHYEKLRLKNEINFLYKKKQHLNLLLYKAELQALDIFGKFWHHIKQLLLEKLSKIANAKYQNLNQKLNKLLETKPVNIHEKDNFQFHEPIKNLSDEQFSDQELNLIAKGYKSNMSNNNNIEKLIVEAEHIIHTNEKLDKNEIRYQISREIKKLKNQKISNNKTLDESIQTKQIKNIIKKIRDKNLTVNKADKGNIITIENKDKLYQKTNSFLENPLYNKLKSDPTQKYQNEIKNLIKQSNLVINNKNNSLINSNPSAPKLRVNIKIHKKDFPIRPIVNYKSAPAYNLQKQLVNILHEKLITNNQYNIKNSVHLTNMLLKIPLSSTSKLISLDIKDMYTNIPIKETLEIIKNQLQSLQYDDHIIHQLTTLLAGSLKQNYFRHQQNFYQQKDGLPMGSPLSPIMSEIFLQYLESINIETLKQQFNIIYYGRYVDDVIIVYNNQKDIGEQILQKFNELHNNIKFTIEKEDQKTINYLDITIKRIKLHNKHILDFNIYRKPTTSKLSIDFNSHHPYEHKIANYRYLLNRLNNIPLSKNNYKKEFLNILSIAQYNNFPKAVIYKLNDKIKNNIFKKKHTTLQNNNNNNQTKNYVAIEYCGSVSDKIRRILGKNNLKVGYKTTNKIQKLLNNKDHEIEKMSCSGIYKLECPCGAQYIGKTTRKFKQRLHEHRYSFIYNKPEKSNYASHLLEHHHPLNNNSFSIIKILNDKKLINTYEELEIFKSYKTGQNINDQLPNIHNPLFKNIITLK